MATLISVGQVVDQSIHHYRKYFKNLLGVSLFLFAGMPLMIASALIFSSESVPRLMVSIACEVLAVVVTAIAGFWVFNALVFTVDGEARGKKAEPKVVSKTAWKKFFPAIGVSALVSLLLISTIVFLMPGYAILFTPMTDTGSMAVLLGGVVFILAGGIAAICAAAWMSVTYVFAPYALLLDGEGIRNSLRRAHALVRGRWWHTMFCVIVPKLVILIIAFFLQYIIMTMVSLLAAGTGASEGTSLLPFVLLANVIKIGFSALVTPLFVLADYYVFRSLVDTVKDAS